MAEKTVKVKTAGLGKKVGPLPLWAWTLLAAGVIYWIFSRSKSTSTTAPAAATTAADGNTGLGNSTGSGLDQQSLVDALGAQNQSLLDQFTVQNQDLLAQLEADLQAWNKGAGGAATGSVGSTAGNGSGGSNTTAGKSKSSKTGTPPTSSDAAAVLAQSLGGVPKGATYVASQNAYTVPATPLQPGGGGKFVLD